jgi:hypothetical protein
VPVYRPSRSYASGDPESCPHFVRPALGRRQLPLPLGGLTAGPAGFACGRCSPQAAAKATDALVTSATKCVWARAYEADAQSPGDDFQLLGVSSAGSYPVDSPVRSGYGGGACKGRRLAPHAVSSVWRAPGFPRPRKRVLTRRPAHGKLIIGRTCGYLFFSATLRIKYLGLGRCAISSAGRTLNECAHVGCRRRDRHMDMISAALAPSSKCRGAWPGHIRQLRSGRTGPCAGNHFSVFSSFC